MLGDYRNLLSFLSVSILSIVIYSCANIVPPDGGPTDTTPPELMAVNPADSQLNSRITEIELLFNKNMEVADLSQHFSISPLLPTPPEIIAYRKKVTISIPDSLLQEETTYFLDFGNALTDNRESTPAANVTYTFSTGSHFDSLTIKGRVLSAETGMGDSSASVVLYPLPMEDSSIIKDLPKYAVHVNSEGYFEFKMLPIGPYELFAIRESSPDFKWDGHSEAIGFIDTILEANFEKDLDHLQLIYTSNPFEKVESMNLEEEEGGSMRKRSKESATIPPYQAKVDTLLNVGQDITKALEIQFADTGIVIDIEKILLTYDADGTDLESIIKEEQQEKALLLNTEWRENTEYTLRLVKGWAKNAEDEELNPGKFTFKTKSNKDYAEIRLKPDSTLINNNYRVVVLQEKDTIIHQAIEQGIIEYKWMQPKNINIFIYQDANQNEQWDAGDYWTKTQPEIIFLVLKDGAVRGGWENEFSIDVPKDPMEQIKNYFEQKQHATSSNMRAMGKKREDLKEEEKNQLNEENKSNED